MVVVVVVYLLSIDDTTMNQVDSVEERGRLAGEGGGISRVYWTSFMPNSHM
jgi:hypothetical protein